MTKVEELVKMLSSRITSYTRAAEKLSRMAGASPDPRERRNLRDESRNARNKAALLQARVNKLNAGIAEDDDLDQISNG